MGLLEMHGSIVQWSQSLGVRASLFSFAARLKPENAARR